MARGSWSLTEAVVTRWTESGLDGKFTATWPAASVGQYSALNDDEARPGTPLPYCVLEQPPDGRLGGDSGTGGSAKEYRDIRFTLTIFANGKYAAGRLARRVAMAMESERLPMPGDQMDRMIRLFRDIDNSQREEDLVHSWTLTYRAVIDGSVDVAHGNG